MSQGVAPGKNQEEMWHFHTRRQSLTTETPAKWLLSELGAGYLVLLCHCRHFLILGWNGHPLHTTTPYGTNSEPTKRSGCLGTDTKQGVVCQVPRPIARRADIIAAARQPRYPGARFSMLTLEGVKHDVSPSCHLPRRMPLSACYTPHTNKTGRS